MTDSVTAPAQRFTFLNTVFDVDKAQAIVATRDGPDDEIEVQAWADQYLPPDPEVSSALYALRISVDWDHVPTVDLSHPLIMAWFEGKATSGCIIIDGYHRLAKARREAVKALPVYVLTKEESKEVTL